MLKLNAKTPIQPIGPFYKETKLSNINDLTNNGKALGKKIEIQGKIVDSIASLILNVLLIYGKLTLMESITIKMIYLKIKLINILKVIKE